MSNINRKASVTMQFSAFQLPPVQDALIIGKRTPVGANSIAKALQEMSPGIFRLIKVDHPIIDALLVRESDLRKLSEEELVPRLLKHAENIMDETDTLHVKVSIEIVVEEGDIPLP